MTNPSPLLPVLVDDDVPFWETCEEKHPPQIHGMKTKRIWVDGRGNRHREIFSLHGHKNRNREHEFTIRHSLHLDGSKAPDCFPYQKIVLEVIEKDRGFLGRSFALAKVEAEQFFPDAAPTAYRSGRWYNKRGERYRDGEIPVLEELALDGDENEQRRVALALMEMGNGFASRIYQGSIPELSDFNAVAGCDLLSRQEFLRQYGLIVSAPAPAVNADPDAGAGAPLGFLIGP